MAWNESGEDGKKNDQSKSPSNNEQGPPNLDEIFGKISQKINSLLGRKSTPKSGTSQMNPKSAGISIGLVLGLIVIIWILSGIFIIEPAEQGVVLLFGKYQRTVEAGPHWIPRFIESETTLNVQKISTYSYAAQMLTQDQNIVDVAVAIQYRIDNANDYLFNVVDPIASLQQATASALRQVIGNTTLDQVLTTGRAEVRDQIMVQLQKTLSIYHAGIIVTDVGLQPARAPEQVKDAFDDAIKAQEDEQRFKNQAEAYAMGVVPIAQGQAKRVLQEAQAYEKQIVLQAQGDVARFLAILPVYQSAPSVTRNRIYLSTIESVLERSNKVFVDTNNGQNLLYLPLNKLMGKGAKVEATHNADSVTDALTKTGNLSNVEPSSSSTRPDRFDNNSDSQISQGGR